MSGNEENPIVADLKDELITMEYDLTEAKQRIVELENKIYDLEEENKKLLNTLEDIEYNLKQSHRR